jgi:FKBP-type peptidyl-prolyl cis-trans isomerase
MKRLVLCALLCLGPAVRAQDPVAREREEREEREREKEREARERGLREHREKAEKGEARAGDEETLYAMGAVLGSRVSAYGLSKKELATVQRGFGDAAANRKLKLKEADLDEWGPKIDAMLQRRGNPRLAKEKERGAKIADEEAKKPGAERLSNGAVVIPERPGQGPNPSPTDRVRVKYEGKLADGKTFDKNDSTEFPLNTVIPCWKEGVQKIKVGGKSRLICPSTTAYGDQGQPPHIPGGATLVFEVELLGIGK